MPLPSVALTAESLAVVAAAVLPPLVLASLVYLDARRRQRSASLAPLAWAAATFFSGVGSPVVVACYAVVNNPDRFVGRRFVVDCR